VSAAPQRLLRDQQQLQQQNNITVGQSVQILSDEDQRCVQMGQPLPKYNACVLYAEADIDHATEIMNNLESERYNLRVSGMRSVAVCCIK